MNAESTTKSTDRRLRQLAETLNREIEWLTRLADARIQSYFSGDAKTPFILPEPPSLRPSGSSYARLLTRIQAGLAERLLIVLALAPHIAPASLDMFFLRNQNTNRSFTEFGGVVGTNHKGFLPSGETFLFLSCGADLALRLGHMRYFDPARPLWVENVLQLAPPSAGEPAWSGALIFSDAALQDLLAGAAS